MHGIVLDASDDNRYTALKSRLLEQFSDSEQGRLKKVFSEIELGSKRSSQFLREIKVDHE